MRKSYRTKACTSNERNVDCSDLKPSQTDRARVMRKATVMKKAKRQTNQQGLLQRRHDRRNRKNIPSRFPLVQATFRINFVCWASASPLSSFPNILVNIGFPYSIIAGELNVVQTLLRYVSAIGVRVPNDGGTVPCVIKICKHQGTTCKWKQVPHL